MQSRFNTVSCILRSLPPFHFSKREFASNGCKKSLYTEESAKMGDPFDAGAPLADDLYSFLIFAMF